MKTKLIKRQKLSDVEAILAHQAEKREAKYRRRQARRAERSEGFNRIKNLETLVRKEAKKL